MEGRRARVRRVAKAVWGLVVLCLLTQAQAQQPYREVASKQVDPFSIDELQANDLATDALDGAAPAEEGAPLDDILSMNLEQLTRVDVVAPSLDMVVTTVTRQESTVGRSPTAIYVVTQDMIRRSGARTIPDVLRMVPGLQVARLDANKWAVSSRGFNSQFANKMLVQIDGRVVYTQTFGGVWWDEVDVLLQDIDRIEVIRGPGATVWGSNAVNGVINIIRKRAADTQGALLAGGGGTEERGFSNARYGGQIGNDIHYRVYAKQFERDAGHAPLGTAHDDWRQVRSGFRMDWQPDSLDFVTLQGDYFEGASGTEQIVAAPQFPFVDDFVGDSIARGRNILFRWTRTPDCCSSWSLQLFYDRIERHYSPFFIEDRDVFDLDFQHQVRLNDRHNFIWGFGYRLHDDRTQTDGFVFDLDPAKRSTDRFGYFLQDEITLLHDRLFFIAGSKFEHNDFTGFEYQPSGRLLWTPDQRRTGWASISRAVRVPTRVEDDLILRLPPTMNVYPEFMGTRQIEAEDVLAYEAGFRAQPRDEFSWDLAVFYNDYNNLIGLRPGPVGFRPGIPLPVLPLTVVNAVDAQTYGYEFRATYQVRRNWHLHGSYSFLRMFLQGAPDAQNPSGVAGQSPRNQVYLRSWWDLGANWEFDLIGRYVDSLPDLNVPSYIQMDARLGWRPRHNLELAIVGLNLLDSHHLEFRDPLLGFVATEVERSVYGMVTWTS